MIKCDIKRHRLFWDFFIGEVLHTAGVNFIQSSPTLLQSNQLKLTSLEARYLFCMLSFVIVSRFEPAEHWCALMSGWFFSTRMSTLSNQGLSEGEIWDQKNNLIWLLRKLFCCPQRTKPGGWRSRRGPWRKRQKQTTNNKQQTTNKQTPGDWRRRRGPWRIARLAPRYQSRHQF